jgi:hypothetical protein
VIVLHKKRSIFLTLILLLTIASPMVSASGTSQVSTSVLVQSNHEGNLSNGGFVYTSANPVFSLGVNNPNNSTIYSTQYEISNSTTTQMYTYNGSFSLNQNHSTELTMRYRSNSSSGLESWKSLTISIDADAPIIELQTNNQTPSRYISDSSVFIVSNSKPLTVVCNDNQSGVQSIQYSMSNITTSVNSTTISITPNSFTQSHSAVIVNIVCVDNVGNPISHNISAILDDEPPSLSVLESGARDGICVGSDWKVYPSSSDNHSNSFVELQSQSGWVPAPQSISPAGNGSSSIVLRATDEAGYSSNLQNWSIYLDTNSPIIQTSLNSTSLQINTIDDCQTGYLLVQWETFTGQFSGWSMYNQSHVSISLPFNGSIVRSTIKSFDSVGNSNTIITNWVNTLGSNPQSYVTMLSDTVGNFSNEAFNLTITPISTNSTVQYILYRNNQSISSGNSSTQIALNYSFNHSDNISLSLNTSNGYGGYSNQVHNWVVDAENSHQVNIALTGTSLSSPSVLLGSTSRLVPGLSSDDSSGVGGSHTSCSWDGVTWFQTQLSSSYVPTSTQGTVQSFTFACRSVDLLGNEGPVTWMNGSVDLQSPNISLSPNPSETIGLNSTIVLDTSDANGISTTYLLLTWSNGSSTSTSNISISLRNWQSSIGQLFTSVSDGTITATAYTEDLLGNTAIISTRTWTLITSNPFVSTSLSGVFYNEFISNDSTTISVTLPTGGWTGLYSNYTLVDDTGVVLFGNSTSSFQLQPTDLAEGQVWLNTTTGDDLGRIQVQSWIFTVDNSNNAPLQINLNGENISINGTLWTGPIFNFSFSGVSDNSGGVGDDIVSCSWDNLSWFDVQKNAQISPSFIYGLVWNIPIYCRNVDLLQNLGPITELMVKVDAVMPEAVIQPGSSQHISPSSTLNAMFSDNLLTGSHRIFIEYQSSGVTNYHNLTTNMNNFNFSINQVFSNTADGIIFVTVFSEDYLGNTNQSSTHTYYVNTSLPVTTLTMAGNYHGSYVASSNFSITLSPPTIGNQPGFSNFTLQHGNGTLITFGNVTTETVISLCDDCSLNESLSTGLLYLNVTSQDIFGRVQNQTMIYYVDIGIGTTPQLSTLGLSSVVNASIVLGANGRINVAMISDDAGGVGASHASCSFDGSSWVNITTSALLSPPSNQDTSTEFSLRCLNVDHLNHQGNLAWLNGSTDLIQPSTHFSLVDNAIVSPNTVITVGCTDSSGCSLAEVALKFQSGGTVTWYSNSVSGVNASFQLSSLINSNLTGNIELYVVSTDTVGNTENDSVNGLTFLYGSPTLSTQIISEHSGIFLSSNVTLKFIPSTGWVNGLSVHVNIEHESNSSTLFTGYLNQSTSTKMFQNLGDGPLWVNATICDAVSTCTNSTQRYLTDLTGPSKVQFFSETAIALINGSFIFKSGDTVSFNSGNDTASGTFSTRCNGSNGAVLFSSVTNTIAIQSLVSPNEWSSITCYSIDNLGNIGLVNQTLVYLDTILPQTSVSFNDFDGVVVPQTWFNVTCDDDYDVSSSKLTIYQSGLQIYDVNGTSTISVQIGNIISIVGSQILSLSISCHDVAGNINQIQETIEFVSIIDSAEIAVESVSSGSTSYVGNGAIIGFSHNRSDVSFRYMIHSNGSNSAWFSANGDSATLDLSNYEHLDVVRIEFEVSIGNSSLVNSSLSSFYSYDSEGPQMSSNQQYSLANGMIIPLSFSDSGSGISMFFWRWDNGTIQQTNNASNIVLPSDVNNGSWLSVYAVDAIGNNGGGLNFTVSRDLSVPEIQINSSHSVYFGPGSLVSGTIFDDTGLRSSTVSIHSGLHSSILATNVSTYTITSSILPHWFWNQSLVEIRTVSISNSGHELLDRFFISPDDVSPTHSIQLASSENYTSLNSSNYSKMYLLASSDISSQCIQHGLNISHAMNSTCISLNNGYIQVNRSSGTYILLISSTDYAGNTRVDNFNLIHHSNLPMIGHMIPDVLRPGLEYNFSVSTIFSYQTAISLNQSLISTEQSSFIVPSGEGIRSLTIHVTNALGLQNSVELDVTLDDSGPVIGFDAQLYGNNHLGTNTSISIELIDSYSNLSIIAMYLNSTTISCSETILPVGLIFWLNGTMNSIFSSSTCPILQETNIAVTFTLIVVDQLGHSQRLDRSMTYHGEIAIPTWISSNSTADAGFVWSSNLSTHTCVANSGTILPSYELHWSPTNQSTLGSSITNLSGNGVATCIVDDEFGNTGYAHLNITTDTTIPAFSVTWPTHSYQTFVRAGTGNFIIHAVDSSSIDSILYCISSTICIPQTSTSGIVTPLPSSGSHTLYLSIINGVGLVNSTSIDFVIDDSLPLQLIESTENSTIIGNNIYLGMVNSLVTVTSTDNHCISDGTYKTNINAQNITANSTVNIPSGANWIEFASIDCVGQTTTSNYTINRLSSISTMPISVSQSSASTTMVSGTMFFHNGGISLLLNSTHPVDFGLQCVVLSQSTCTANKTNIGYMINVSSSTQEVVELHLSDNLGNNKIVLVNTTADLSSGNCVPSQFVQVYSGELIIPSNRNTIFTCIDNGTGIESVGWDTSQGFIQWTSLGNGTWSAPAILYQTTNIVITDNVDNTAIFSYNITLDSTAPVIFLSPDGTEMNFDEKRSRSDGRFVVSCLDGIFSHCELDVVIDVIGTGEIISNGGYVNNATISLSGLQTSSIIRISVNSSDAVGNIQTRLITFTIDDEDPQFNLTSFSSSGVALSQGIVSENGTIQLLGLSNDVNFTLSSDWRIDCGPLTTTQSYSFSHMLDLSQINLSGCQEVFVEVVVRDHVGNSFSDSKSYSIDFLSPSVDFIRDTSCSKRLGSVVDTTSSCILQIKISDDAGLLKGDYTLNYIVDGNVIKQDSVGLSYSIDFSEFENEVVTLKVSGIDKVGNLVEPNNIIFAVSDELTPIWTGLLCSDGTVCDMTEDAEVAPTGSIVQVSTSNSKADIEFVNITLVNLGQSQLKFNSSTILSDQIADGEYLMSVDLKDELGRTYISQATRFVYDTKAPIIEIIEIKSTGLLDDGRVLSCGGCQIVWRINDLTNTTSFTNHGLEEMEGIQYSIETSLLGDNHINITATDDFGRITFKNFTTTSILATNLEISTERQEYENVHVHCIEIEPISSTRQIKCLWTRKQPTIEFIPLAISVEIDQEELRNVQLVIQKPGASPLVESLTNGQILLTNIYSFDSIINLELVDKYSQTNEIQLQMVEHTRGWESVSLLTNSVGEDDNLSKLNVVFEPPQGENRHLVLERGYAEMNDFYSCSVEYKFRTNQQNEVTVLSNQCKLLDESINFMPDGKMRLIADVNHSGIREQTGIESLHPSPLFNLFSLRLIIEYNDVYGIESESNYDELLISEEVTGTSIERTKDRPPKFETSSSSECPLDFGDKMYFSADGYLQSQESVPISECERLFSDEDGIDWIVWNFTFTSGRSVAYVEIACTGSYFPVDWDFAEAERRGYCTPPKGTFPDGVFDVEIRPLVVDAAAFNRDQIEYIETSFGMSAKPVFEDCDDDNQCSLLMLNLEKVSVSSDMSPAQAIENSKELVQSASSISGSFTFVLLFILIIAALVAIGVVSFRKIKSRLKASLDSPKENVERTIPVEDLEFDMHPSIINNVIDTHNIHDRESFIKFAEQFDHDNDVYLNKEELLEAATEYVKRGLNI